MNPITEIKSLLDQIEQREKAATEGPWLRDPSLSFDHIHTLNPTTAVGNKHNPLATLRRYNVEEYKESDGNADFIAHSRTDVPKLGKALRMAIYALEGDEKQRTLEQILTELKS